MTSQEKFDILNSYYGVVSQAKWHLLTTDWYVVKSTEIGADEPADIKDARTNDRATINQYEEWIKEIEAITPDDPDRDDDDMPKAPEEA